MAVSRTGNHDTVAKAIANSVKNKPNRSAQIIHNALVRVMGKMNGMIKKPDDDKEWREHIVVIARCTGAELPPDFIAQVKALKAPGASYSSVKGKYGSVSASLVEDFCNAERNVTEDKIREACGKAAAKENSTGVKELTGHKTYIAELKITGASKRLYAKKKSGACYTFEVLGKHT
ncbi:MAG: hypothetical protein AAGF60_09585 [Pseudomonadota bacterium]